MQGGGRVRNHNNKINHKPRAAANPPEGEKMKVIYKKTNEVIVDDCKTLAEAQGVVRVCVMFTNERIKRGIQTGKRENKNDYLIIE